MDQIKCKLCGGWHKARSDKFPLVLYGNRDIIDEITKRIVRTIRVIIGYACRKCQSKYRKQQQANQPKKGWVERWRRN